MALELGLQEGATHTDLASLGQERRQDLVDTVQRRVLRLPANEILADQEEVSYAGGFSVKVSRSYLRANGHELESAAYNAFSHLRRFHNSGDLLLNIIDPMLVELPALVPDVILAALRELLNASLDAGE